MGHTAAAIGGMIRLLLPRRSRNGSPQEVVRLAGQAHRAWDNVVVCLGLHAGRMHGCNQYNGGDTGKKQSGQKEQNGESALRVIPAGLPFSDWGSLGSRLQELLAYSQVLVEAAVLVVVPQVREHPIL